MGYWQLKNQADDYRAWYRTYYALPPDACPLCGVPLQVGWQSVGGGGRIAMRHCDMGHYTWTGGPRIT